MKKWMIVLMVFGFIFLLLKNPIAAAADFTNFKGRAISLKVLQQKLKSLHGKGARPTTLFHLCGLTRINGYVVDEANKDVILIGSVDHNKPPLYLDDFVVALRNAWMKYAELKGNTNYYSNPGCSIDPDPQVMAKLDEIGNQLKKSSQTSEVEKALEQWEKVCSSPQEVRVMGIPFNSHFAWVMVKADYDMKKIADGTHELNLLWFSTLSDLQMEEAKKQYIHGHSTASSNESMNRFWFYPGEFRFLEDINAVMIETCKVKLLTEEEHLTSKGDISGTGRSNPIAEKFVNDFTYFYPEVAAQSSIYYELENLFRFVALAKIMKLKAPHEKVGLSLDYLLNQYPILEKKVETYLPGRSNINHYKRQRESVEGYQVSQLWLPSCGGVSMDMEVGPQHFKKEKNDSFENVKACATKGMVLEDRLFCDFTADAKEVHIVIKRKFSTAQQKDLNCILGEMYINGKYFGRTLELPDREGQKYISSVPEGTYDACLRSRSDPDNPWRIQLKKPIEVSDPLNPGSDPIKRDPIQIHHGTLPKHTEGCPLVAPGPPFGSKNATCNLGDFNNSREFYDKLLQEYFGSSQCPDTNTKITLTIQGDYK